MPPRRRAQTPPPQPQRPPEVHPAQPVSRRRVLELGGATAAAVPLLGPAWSRPPILGPTAAVAAADLLQPEIKPRATWAQDLPVAGPIQAEEDVRFLLVHHTASTNAYQPEDVANQIRGFYRFHTGPEKGWPDVAYNFFVDRFGGIWEARAGSIDGAVRGDATGGSQGFALLCSLIGDHRTEAVTAEAKAAMTRLLAWLSVRYDIDPTPGATVQFTSRGSSRWPTGATVTARTISGHRDMSETACPGEAAYRWIGDELPNTVTAVVSQATASLGRPDGPEPTLVPPSSTTATTAGAATTVAVPASSTTDPDESIEDAAGVDDGQSTGWPTAVLAGAGALVAATLAGAVRLRRRTDQPR